jgi:ATP-dependent helicase/DNAse subunit B
LPEVTQSWLAFRQQLAPADAACFHGSAGRRAATTYAVSHLERYLACPFKYFAGRVLGLEEERDEESGLTPQERGQFLHLVFETFYKEWSAAGHRTITAESVEDALELFERIAERHLANLREGDRALERTYLLGSAVAPGLAERAFASEIEHGVGVAQRLLEHALEGTFTFEGAKGRREIALRAKADRIDLLEDGTLRIIDYKIGRAPKLTRSLQLPVYGICAQQDLDGRHGRHWTISRAGYIAFKEKNPFVSIGMNLEKALEEGQERLISAVQDVEEGNFPPRPDEPWLCSRCGYALVCRKDYVGDD